jgi:hypothetical protein
MSVLCWRNFDELNKLENARDLINDFDALGKRMLDVALPIPFRDGLSVNNRNAFDLHRLGVDAVECRPEARWFHTFPLSVCST